MIQLYNQDCLDAMREMRDNEFDLAIVDPPYGIKEDGAKNHSRGLLAKSKEYTPKNWDTKPMPKEYFIELQRVSKNQIIFGANHFIENIPKANSSCWIVWNKDNGQTDFADCELAYASFKTAVRMFSFKWQGMLQGNMKNKEIRIHPTQKPVALYLWLLQKYAQPGDKVLDTHLGSGSSALAAHDLGFDFVGYELDTEYFDKAQERLRQHQRQLSLFGA